MFEQDDERAYFRHRAEEERMAAEEASCMVKDVHLELAELYAARARPRFPHEPGDTDRAAR